MAILFNDLSGNCKEFAIACHDMNSEAELELAVNQKADKYDMAAWSITESEWIDAINVALTEKQFK